MLKLHIKVSTIARSGIIFKENYFRLRERTQVLSRDRAFREQKQHQEEVNLVGRSNKKESRSELSKDELENPLGLIQSLLSSNPSCILVTFSKQLVSKPYNAHKNLHS